VLATLLAGASQNELSGQVLNVGTGRRVTVLELAQLLAQQTGHPHVQPIFKPERPGDVRHSLADISAAKQLLGYEPVTRLEDGLVETVEWYRRAFAGA
jgi:nucleoside-diphosphate-sugar epimerase